MPVSARVKEAAIMNGDAWSTRGELPLRLKTSNSTALTTLIDSGRHSSSRHQGSRGDKDDRRGGERRDRDSRRRSRSPAHRSSRREYEVDSYSSSRDYREREREDRYEGRARREDRPERAWDRGDRGDRDRTAARRDPRRDDDRRRDPFDDRGDRGRGGRRDRGDRDGGFGGGRGARNQSASPPPKKREPTPDLTDVGSLMSRKRLQTAWDIKPAGLENVTAEQAKLSGMYPLPGAPRTQAMDPSRLQAFINQPAGAASSSTLRPSNARQAKRLIVKNIPPHITNPQLVEFFNLQLNGLNIVSAHDPCVSAHISSDRVFSLVEFKAPEDATAALALDGITMTAYDTMDTSNGVHNGSQSGLKIRRPQDYIVPVPDASEEPEPGVASKVKESANKICVTNIPTYLDHNQVAELLVAFGELKAFILAKDADSPVSRVSLFLSFHNFTKKFSPSLKLCPIIPVFVACTCCRDLFSHWLKDTTLKIVVANTGKGIAFVEYADPNHAEIALEGLNNMELGESHLKVQRACVGLQQMASTSMGVSAMSMLASSSSKDMEGGRVLQLLNMVTLDELKNDLDYQGMTHRISCRAQRTNTSQTLFKKSARKLKSMALFSASRSLARMDHASLLALARSMSSSKTQHLPRKLPLLLPAASSLSAPLWSPSLERFVPLIAFAAFDALTNIISGVL